MIHTLTKTAVVVVSATILSTLAVNAVDMRGHFATTMLGSLLFGVEKPVAPCPEHMTLVESSLTPFCVDRYEASPGPACAVVRPEQADETSVNIADPACVPVSEPHREPWVYVSRHDAAALCEKAGKRLPEAHEWYVAAIGTNDPQDVFTAEGCNLARNRADGAALTGEGFRCVSDVGAFDMVGNVWEWVADDVVDGMWQDRALPNDGLIDGVDVAGMPFTISVTPDVLFAGDRFWLDRRGTMGLLRGGYYDSKHNGGVYSVYAASKPEFSGEAVGFRCVADVAN